MKTDGAACVSGDCRARRCCARAARRRARRSIRRRRRRPARVDASRSPDHRRGRRRARHAQQAVRQQRRGRPGRAVHLRAAVPLRPVGRVSPGRRDRGADARRTAASRNDQNGHAAHPQGNAVVGRRAVRRARPGLHLASRDEPAQQHAADDRLGRHRVDRPARPRHGVVHLQEPYGGILGIFALRRRRLSAAARAPARGAARSQPRAVQQQADLERAVRAHGVEPRLVARVRREPALLARQAGARPHHVPHHPERRHAVQRCCRRTTSTSSTASPRRRSAGCRR